MADRSTTRSTQPEDQAPSLLAAARGYALAGWPVFPCNPETKQPLTRRSFHDASTDLKTVEAWWVRHSTAMIGVPTGPAINAWVLDVDDPASFEAACDIPLPNTRRCQTGKGYHLYFAWDSAAPVINAQRSSKGWGIPGLPGADVRGQGGYVIVPPSIHPSGKPYTWDRNADACDAPDELMRLVRERRQAPAAAQPTDRPVKATRITPIAGQDTPYGLAALKDECLAVSSALPGAQEGTLNEAALKLGALVGGGSLTARTAASALIRAGGAMVTGDPQHPWTAEAITHKVQRGLHDGMTNPRFAPQARAAGQRKEPTQRRPANDGADGRPLITVRGGELHSIASEAEEALIRSKAPFYVRGESIVRPVVDRLPGASGTPIRIARLVPVLESTMVDHLSRAATWEKFDGRKNAFVPADPPANVAQTIISRDGEWKFNRLSGVITTPTMRPDGTILSEPGYDRATGLLLLEPPRLPPIPDAPSRNDALAAVAKLSALLEGFPFTDEESRAVALSALITPVVRAAMPAAPMHAMSATMPGSGKSYFVDVVSGVSTGERAAVLSAGKTEEESEKRLGAAVIEGHSLISIDNVNGDLGGEFLCQLIERPIVAPRVLGATKLVRVENRACCFATGNNIRLVGDMTRRVLLCSLDPNVERPELRTFTGDPFKTVTADRASYIAAALIIVRAYAVAGYPGTLPPLASFEAWSKLVRSALVWLGQSDPVQTMERARAEDPVAAGLTTLFTAWHGAVGSAALSVAQIIDAAESVNSMGNAINTELREAIAEVGQDRFGKLSGKVLGIYLSRYAGRIAAGLKLTKREDGHAKQKLWQVSVAAS